MDFGIHKTQNNCLQPKSADHDKMGSIFVRAGLQPS